MITAIILAGGSSKRMGEGIDKLMFQAAHHPLLAHVLLAFQQCKDIDEIVLVARKDRQANYKNFAEKYRISKLVTVISGGIERQDSVWCGLQAISPHSQIVLIHDAARALVTTDIISKCICAARKTGAAIPAARLQDTIKRTIPTSTVSANGSYPLIEATLDRLQLWAAQTPQTFQLDLIRRAYEPLIQKRIVVTDDAAAVERLGHLVSIIETTASNLKITVHDDLVFAEAILSNRKAI